MEELLVKKIKSGDSHAFRMLYANMADFALRNAYAIVKDMDSAGDVVQETFIRIYKSINSYDQTKPFKPWFYRILLNECYRYIDKNTRVELTDEIEQYTDFDANEEEDNYDIERVQKAISLLEDIHRVPVTLKYLNDFSEKEIAEILELNVNTVKSRLFKGRKALKELLGRDEYECEQVR